MLNTTRQPLLARSYKPTLSMLQVQQQRSVSWHSQDYHDVNSERRRRLELDHYKDQQKADYETMAALRASNQLKSEIISDLRDKLRQQQSSKADQLDDKPEVAVQRSQKPEPKQAAKDANQVAEPSAVQLRQRSEALRHRESISEHLKDQKSAAKDHTARQLHDQELRWPTYQEAEPLILYSKQQLDNIKRELEQVNQTEKEVKEPHKEAKVLPKEEKVLSKEEKEAKEQATKDQAPDSGVGLDAVLFACVFMGVCLAVVAAPVLMLIDSMLH